MGFPFLKKLPVERKTFKCLLHFRKRRFNIFGEAVSRVHSFGNKIRFRKRVDSTFNRTRTYFLVSANSSAFITMLLTVFDKIDAIIVERLYSLSFKYCLRYSSSSERGPNSSL